MIPVRHTGFMDWTRDKGPRMCWQFWFADGSSISTFDQRKAFHLANLEMKHGTETSRPERSVRAVL